MLQRQSSLRFGLFCNKDWIILAILIVEVELDGHHLFVNVVAIGVGDLGVWDREYLPLFVVDLESFLLEVVLAPMDPLDTLLTRIWVFNLDLLSTLAHHNLL